MVCCLYRPLLATFWSLLWADKNLMQVFLWTFSLFGLKLHLTFMLEKCWIVTGSTVCFSFCDHCIRIELLPAQGCSWATEAKIDFIHQINGVSHYYQSTVKTPLNIECHWSQTESFWFQLLQSWQHTLCDDIFICSIFFITTKPITPYFTLDELTITVWFKIN